MASTYGTWLRGDPRGWRARHHREHVEGDYKNPPPPGPHDDLYERSKQLMKREEVRVEDASLRRLVVDEFVARLVQDGLGVVIASFDDHHLHVLVQCPGDDPRHRVGLAKKHTSLLLRQRGLHLSDEGGLWAKRSKNEPVVNRSHQLNTTLYILNHEERGAEVWCLPVVRTSKELQRLREQRDARRRNRRKR
jgi:REP element-mobilizing transposase RayT